MISFDFRVVGRMELLRQVSDKLEAIWFDPWTFSEENASNKRRARISEILKSMEEAINMGSSRVLVFQEEDLNVSIVLAVEKIKPSKGIVPERDWGFHSATLTGYAPDRMFEEFVNGRLERKFKKRQTAIARRTDERR